MKNLIVRYGPAPGDTADGKGKLHSTFTGFFLLELSDEESRHLEGAPRDFLRIAGNVWRRAVADGHGHILIGKYTGFEIVVPLSQQSCGAAWGTTSSGHPYAPINYKAIFAVARSARPPEAPADGPDHLDIAIDYRGTTGPGDPSIRPIIFDIGDCAPLPPA